MRCPFCRKDIKEVEEYRRMYEILLWFIDGDELEGDIIDAPNDSSHDCFICVECGEELPLMEGELEDFLRGKIALARSEEVVRKGNYAVYENKVYKIKRTDDGVLVLERVRDETIEALILSSL